MANKIVCAAYDFKAALDLAAAFARSGLTVEVFNKTQYDPCKAQAAVYNLESFFWDPDKEYTAMYDLFSKVPPETLCFLKSDSSLRGNIGSELRALMDSRGETRLLFIPALPGAQKFTKNGVQYQFKDGQEIVLADANRLIASFRGTSVAHTEDEEGIRVADCTSETAFDCLVDELSQRHPTVLAGTSALAGRLARALALPLQASVPLDGKQGVLRLDSLEWEELG